MRTKTETIILNKPDGSPWTRFRVRRGTIAQLTAEARAAGIKPGEAVLRALERGIAHFESQRASQH